MKVNVVVKPKEAVLDPQGGAVRDAMRHLGMPEVRSVRIGKYMEIDVDGEGVEVEKRLHGLCRELLSNPVIEDYEVRKPEVRAQPPAHRGLRPGGKSEVRAEEANAQRSTSNVSPSRRLYGAGGQRPMQKMAKKRKKQ
jgi:phosphoribosylformylglycinamidine synthase subunit PurS